RSEALSWWLAREDLVGCAQPGAGRGQGGRCAPIPALDELMACDTLPPAERSRRKLAAANRKFADLCQRDSGKVLPYVGTVNAARDMDRMRTALGDEKLNYFGMSYGTQDRKSVV